MHEELPEFYRKLKYLEAKNDLMLHCALRIAKLREYSQKSIQLPQILRTKDSWFTAVGILDLFGGENEEMSHEIGQNIQEYHSHPQNTSKNQTSTAFTSPCPNLAHKHTQDSLQWNQARICRKVGCAGQQKSTQHTV